MAYEFLRFAILISFAFVFSHSQTHSLNNCGSVKLVFKNDDQWPIYVNKHCSERVRAYHIYSGGMVWDGLYETYGYHLDAPLYQMFTSAGTTSRLMRHKFEDSLSWIIVYGNDILFYSKSMSPNPPRKGWSAVSPLRPIPVVSRVDIPGFKPIELPTNIKPFDTTSESYFNATKSRREAQSVLEQMIHPGVSRELGERLRGVFLSAEPYEAITLDGLFDTDLLRESMTFLDIPLNEWSCQVGINSIVCKYSMDTLINVCVGLIFVLDRETSLTQESRNTLYTTTSGRPPNKPQVCKRLLGAPKWWNSWRVSLE